LVVRALAACAVFLGPGVAAGQRPVDPIPDARLIAAFEARQVGRDDLTVEFRWRLGPDAAGRPVSCSLTVGEETPTRYDYVNCHQRLTERHRFAEPGRYTATLAARSGRTTDRAAVTIVVRR
jgi:hypothetical protein